MQQIIFLCIQIPFICTALGAGAIFFVKQNINCRTKSTINSFAAGVMTAASIFSLIIPATQQAKALSTLSLISCCTGFFIAMTALLVSDLFLKYIKSTSNNMAIIQYSAITLHNIPEGMAVGIAFAGAITGFSAVTFAAALTVTVGIAIQNIPEGAITSLTLYSSGVKRKKAFILGILSGIFEPISACAVIIACEIFLPLLPFMLCFAAGAMIYVVVTELIPSSLEDNALVTPVISFTLGFTIMMVLDVFLG